jgi:esterase/lipase superfamily enzyme
MLSDYLFENLSNLLKNSPELFSKIDLEDLLETLAILENTSTENADRILREWCKARRTIRDALRNSMLDRAAVKSVKSSELNDSKLITNFSQEFSQQVKDKLEQQNQGQNKARDHRNIDDTIESFDQKFQLEDSLPINQTSRVEIPIFFATDRRPIDTSSVKTFYGGKRNSTGQLEYGLAKVSIPEDHRMGEIERPNWLKLEFREDPQKHVMLLNIDTFDRDLLISTLRSSLSTSKKTDLLLFTHGYNTSFEDAALRTAQIAYDLQFPGQAVLYSWPSEARTELYTSDENNIDWTIPHFEEFLTLLLTAVGANTINMIAHSMGNRILMRAINDLDRSQLPAGAAKLNNVIFAAPDIDADTFKQFAKKFKEKADRLTLYASSNDKALQASKLVHGGYPRAGDSGESLVIVEGLDTIDASLVDTSFMGHSYFGDNRSIISDIFYLIQHNLAPSRRSGLKSKTIQDLYYWLFQP